jgi:hypothetical protein
MYLKFAGFFTTLCMGWITSFAFGKEQVILGRQVLPNIRLAYAKTKNKSFKTKLSSEKNKVLNTKFEQIHRSPIVLKAGSLKDLQYYSLSAYRVFKTNRRGEAEPIPFQIDEFDRYEDSILDKGDNPNSKSSNGVFSDFDELVFMGGDVGRAIIPMKWNFRQPDILYEVLFVKGKKKGAVYIGLYDNSKYPIPKEAMSTKKYVFYYKDKDEVLTSEYRYLFNKKNYLVVKDVYVQKPKGGQKHLLDSSTFYLKVDFKYFLNFSVNQEDIDSKLDAYKSGPIRTIARVDFTYKLLGIKFDLGMYTEVSFFSNSIYLPAVIDNPIDGKKSLNRGSLFYYGFSLMDNPQNLDISTNMPSYKKEGFISSLFSAKEVNSSYWLTALAKDYMMYIQFKPSKQMLVSKNIPSFYLENVSGDKLESRPKKAAELGKSNVNVAVSFDMKNLDKDVHEVGFKFFIDNNPDLASLNELKTLGEWSVHSRFVR